MLLPLFEWMESLAVYGSSIYLGPAVNIVHLCAMVMFLGALMVVDLRLIGVGLTHQRVDVLTRDARPWMLIGLVVLVLTGTPALMATATAQYGNSIFWVKMYLLGLGLLFTFTVRNRVALSQREPGGLGKLVGLTSIVIWLSVAALARLIMMIPGNTFEWLVGASVR